MGLRGYILGRLIQLIPTILLIICVNFIIIAIMPGDPITGLIGEGFVPPPEWIELMRQKYGLDRSILERLGLYVWNVLRGDLGQSFAWNKPVLDVLLSRTVNTLLLTITSQVLALPIGVFLGAYMAKNYLTKKDTTISLLGLATYSMPVFWIALLLMYFFGVYLRWLPISGMVSIGAADQGSLLDVLRHMILPVIPLTLHAVVMYFRISRASVVEILGEDYITTARAKGLTERRVFYRHALRNALLPTVTVAGIMLGHVLSGALITETVFAWPGIGDLTVSSINKRDYPMLMGIFFFTSILVLIFSLVTDLLYAYLDPRIKYK